MHLPLSLPAGKPKEQRDGSLLHALAWPSKLFSIFPVVLFCYCFSSPTPVFTALNLYLTSSSPEYLSRGLSLPGADAAQTIDPLSGIWLWLRKTANKVERAGWMIMGISLMLYSFMGLKWRKKCLLKNEIACLLAFSCCLLLRMTNFQELQTKRIAYVLAWHSLEWRLLAHFPVTEAVVCSYAGHYLIRLEILWKDLTEASVEILSQTTLVLTILLIILVCFVVHRSHF